jgi:DNA replication protein DnaC
MMKYAEANIPIEYWSLAFKDFNGDKKFKEAIAAKIENIDKVYEDGKSLAFVGNLGVGKTYAACSMLKKAIVCDYSAKYINMADIVNELIASKDKNINYLDELINVDFLLADEYDKRHIFPSEKTEQLFGQTLEYVLRNRFQNHMPTILCSNTQEIDKVLAGEDFSRVMSSLMKKYVEIYYVAGKDYRKCQ